MNLVQRLFARYDMRAIGLIFIFAYLCGIVGAVFIAQFEIKDFISFYAAADLSLQGRATEIYTPQAFTSYIDSLSDGDSLYPWFYPPTTLVALIPLAWLPPYSGYLISIFGQLALFSWLAFRFFGKDHLIIFALAGSGVLVNALYNQFGTLWACLFLLAMQSLKEDHQARAGFWLALLSLKPHYGILIPVALLASGSWRCIGVTCAVIMGMVAISLMLFGVETWLAFFESLSFSSMVVQNPAVYFGSYGNHMTNAMSFAQSLGAPVWMRWSLQTGITLICALVVFRTWYGHRWGFHWRVAVLALTTFISMPWSFTYDAPLLNLWMAYLLLAIPGPEGIYQEKYHGLIILLWLLPLLVLSISLLNWLPDGMSNILFLLPVWLTWRLRNHQNGTPTNYPATL